MPRYLQQGGIFNTEIVSELYLEASNGYSMDLRKSLAGDIVIVPVKAGEAVARVDGKTIGAAAGEDADGSITITLHARALSAIISSAIPTLHQVLTQTGNGTLFQPYTVVPTVDADGDADQVFISRRLRCWKFVIVLQPDRSGSPDAIAGTRLTVYADVTNPDINIVNVGGISPYTITGKIRREGHIVIANT